MLARNARPLAAFLSISAVTFTLACTTVVQTVTLSEDPTYFVVGSTSGDVKSIFSTSDEKVVLRVVFAPNFVGGYRTFTVEWIRPDGTVYIREPARTGWGSNETLFASLNIAGSEPSRMPGQWSVRLLYKDEQLTARTFTIE